MGEFIRMTMNCGLVNHCIRACILKTIALQIYIFTLVNVSLKRPHSGGSMLWEKLFRWTGIDYKGGIKAEQATLSVKAMCIVWLNRIRVCIKSECLIICIQLNQFSFYDNIGDEFLITLILELELAVSETPLLMDFFKK